jgi:hypothetical protein
VLFDRGDELSLAHPARPRDAKLLRDLLQVRNEQLREVTDRSALRPGGGGGTLSADGRVTDGGVLGRGSRVAEEFGGVAH